MIADLGLDSWSQFVSPLSGIGLGSNFDLGVRSLINIQDQILIWVSMLDTKLGVGVNIKLGVEVKFLVKNWVI